MVGWSVRARVFCAALMIVSTVVAVTPSPSEAQSGDSSVGCANPATETTAATAMTVTDLWPDLWIRSGPSRDCDTIVEKVPAGATVTRTAISSSGDWSFVRSAAGNTGWVESDRLRTSSGGGTAPSNSGPIIILDTDMGPDVDDALALAMLHGYANEGSANIGAVTLSRNSDWGVKYISLLNTYYGRSQIPIGSFKGSTGKDNDEANWFSRSVVAGGRYPFDQSMSVASVPAGHEVMRSVLEQSAPGRVVIVQVGFSTNTAELLRRYPDLVREKAPTLSIMAGQSGNPSHRDFNTKFALEDARKVWADWPHKIIQSEDSVGRNLLYPYEEITGRLGTNHPIRRSYEAADLPQHKDNPPFYDMRTWDLTSVMEAVEPNAYLPVDRRGWVSIDMAAQNTVFRADGSGRHHVLQRYLSSSENRRTVDRMVQLVSAPRGSTATPPSGGGSGSLTGQFEVIASPEGYTTLGVRSAAERTTPNEENVVAWLSVGDVVSRQSVSGEWSRVTTQNDITGWVETERIQATDGNTSSTSNQFRVAGLYDLLGVRSSPEQTVPNEENVDTWVPKGEIVTRLGVVGDWSEVVAPNGIRGWVQTEFIEPVIGDGGTNVGVEGQFRVITSPEGYTNLGVRSEDRRTTPNEENVITWLSTGDLVMRRSNRGEWSEVTTANDKTGWVETARIEPTGSGGGTGTINGQFRVNGDYEYLGVRSTPEQTTPNEQNVDTWVPRGDIVTRSGVQGAWSKVRAPNGIEGWVQTEFLEAIDGSGGSSGPVSGQFEVITSPEGYTNLGVRSAAERTTPNDANVVTWLTAGDLVSRSNVDGEWSYIQAPNGTFGYVETVRLRSTGTGGGGSGPSTPVDVGPLPSDGTPIIIFDTDMGPDIDDALALAMLHEYANRGMAKIAAVTLSRNSDWGVKYISLLNTYYGRGGQIPIGAFKGSTGRDGDERNWYSRSVVDGGQHPYDRSISMASVPAGHEVMRAVIDQAPPNSVAIVQVGFSTNTAELLRRYPDLVQEKAPLLSIMAGQNGQRNSQDFNTKYAVADAQKVWSDWPHKIIQSEQRLGSSLLYPYEEITGRLGTDHPIRQSYEAKDFSWHHDNPPFYDMRTWDLTSVMEAIEPNAYLPVESQGWVSLDTSVVNTVFRADSSGRHFVLQRNLSDAEKQRTVDRMVELVSAPPSSNPNPPTPPPSTRRAVPEYAENPYRCDGVSRIAGRFVGFSGDEPVTISWPGGEKTEAAVNGTRTFRWRCFSGSETVFLKAVGEVSGRVGWALLDTYTPAPPSGPVSNPGACPANKEPITTLVTYPVKLTEPLVDWFTSSCERRGSISDHSNFTWLGYYGEWSWIMLGLGGGGTEGWVRTEYLRGAIDPGVIFPNPGGSGPSRECSVAASQPFRATVRRVSRDTDLYKTPAEPFNSCVGATDGRLREGAGDFEVKAEAGGYYQIDEAGPGRWIRKDDVELLRVRIIEPQPDGTFRVLTDGDIIRRYQSLTLEGLNPNVLNELNAALAVLVDDIPFDSYTGAALYLSRGLVFDDRKCFTNEANISGCSFELVGFVPFGKLKLLGRAASAGTDGRTLNKVIDDAIAVFKTACSFSSDTRVLMADGSGKKISEVQVGDSVWAYDPFDHHSGAQTVTAIWPHEDLLYEFAVGDDSILTTEDHPFWNATDREWQGPQEFTLGDTLLTADGNALPAMGLDWLSARTGLAYDISVDELHTFFVAVGHEYVLVHNAPACSVLSAPRAFNRGQRQFSLDQGTASAGWKHIYDRHVDLTKFPNKSKFSAAWSEDDIVEILQKTLRHGKESTYAGNAVFEYRSNFKSVGYTSYRATVLPDGRVQTFHPLG